MLRFVIMFFVFAVNVPAQSSQELVSLGDRHFDQFDMLSAYESYKKAFEADSSNFDALWKMAVTLIELGNELPKSPDQKDYYLKAEGIARRAVNLNPNHFRGHITLAQAIDRVASTLSGSDRVRRLNEMRMEAEKGLKLNESSPCGLWLLGRWHREMAGTGWIAKNWSRLFDGSFPPSSYEEALHYLERSCVADDSSIVYRFDLGKTFINLDKWDSAKVELTRIVEMKPVRKNDRKYQRVAGRYLDWLAAKRYSDLKDEVDEY